MPVYIGTDGVIDNRGTFRSKRDQDLRRTGNAPHLILNTGLFTKTVGLENEDTFVDVPFNNNDGVVSVTHGRLRLTQGSVLADGEYTADRDASLTSQRAHTNSTAQSPERRRTVRFSGSTLTTGASGAVLDFGGTGFQWASGNAMASETGPLTNVGLFRIVSTPSRTFGPGTFSIRLPLHGEWGSAVHRIKWHAGQSRVRSTSRTDQDIRRTGAAPHLITNTGACSRSRVGAVGESTFIDVAVVNEDGEFRVDVGRVTFSEGGHLQRRHLQRCCRGFTGF